jgi:hypothetical protein
MKRAAALGCVCKPKEANMLKLLIVLPMVLVGMMLLGAGALIFVPLLAMLPVLLAAGAAIFALVFVIGLLAFLLRLICALFIGVGAIAIGGIGLFAMLAGGAVMLVFGVLFAHLLIPLLVIAGIVWLIHRAGRTPVHPPIAHGS